MSFRWTFGGLFMRSRGARVRACLPAGNGEPTIHLVYLESVTHSVLIERWVQAPFLSVRLTPMLEMELLFQRIPRWIQASASVSFA